MSYPINPAQRKSLPLYGSSDLRFPVNAIYCVARNYADHAREMGQDPDREPPFFFMKPANALLHDQDNFNYPVHSNNVHHEVEMVVALQSGGRNISADEAQQHIYGYGVGLDMTCRDIQSEAKKAGRPWETAKAFPGSAPCSEIVPAEICGHPTACDISLRVNDKLVQTGNTSQMIWNTNELISTLSELFTLEPGDLIFTGTPAGVGPVTHGDQLEARLDEIAILKLSVVGNG